MKTNRFFTFSFAFLSLLFFNSVGVDAQCSDTGIVIYDEVCGVKLLLNLDDNNVYELVGTSLEENDFLYYEADSIGQGACTGLTTVELICVQVDSNSNWTCIDPDYVDPNANCENTWAPVCGCDEITYDNECKAIAAGVMSYEVGTCNFASSMECDASFVYSISGNTVTFVNTSEADEEVYWFFCENESIETSNTVTHEFTTDGVYLVLLLSGNNDCLDATFKLITIGDSSQNNFGCEELADYVFPGDTDLDGFANLFDLLNLGVGFDVAGFPRPGANEEWYGQVAMDWGDWVDDVNYKHLDCDGDGLIESSDMYSIDAFATPIPAIDLEENVDLPTVYLKLNVDTIVLSDDSMGDLTLSADLMVASGAKPVFGMYGLAVGLTYPGDLVPKPIVVDYQDNSFLGSSNDLLWKAKDFKGEGQLDMAFVKKNHVDVDGYGAVAKIDIIIVEDIITLRTGKFIPVELKINSVKMIDKNGQVKEVRIKNGGTATVIVVNNITVNTTAPAIQSKVVLYPSPAKDQLSIKISELHPIAMEVYDILGQKIYAKSTVTNFTEIDVKGWNTGHYVLKLQTQEGLVVKKFFKGR